MPLCAWAEDHGYAITIQDGQLFTGYATLDETSGGLNIGDSFTVGDITYSITNTDPLQVQVGEGDWGDVAIDSNFEGTLEIPSVITGPDGNTYAVTAIASHAFYRCNFRAVVLPATIESIGVCAFRECDNMESINLPSSLIRISTEAFADCKSLTAITIPKSVKSISINAFQSCSGLTSMVVEDGNTVYDSRDNCNAIIETEWDRLVFGCQKTIIPNTVTTIATRSFFGNDNLMAISFPKSVTSIESHAFYQCSALTSVTIPSSVTKIGDNPFAYCENLESVSVEEGNTAFDMRDNCNAVIRTANNELVIGCKNTIIPASVEIIGHSAFYCCSSLTSVRLPGSLTEIADEAFVNCTGLTSISFPNTLTKIGVWAFQGCRFSSVVFPSGLTEIGRLAFSACYSLTSVTIPNSVTYFGDSSFAWSNNITTIKSKIAEPQDIQENVFFAKVYENAVLTVPAGTKEKYLAVSGWKEFKNIVEQEGLEPVDESDNGDFSQDGDINIETDLNGTVVSNKFYNIGTDAGGYNAEEGCIVITKETSDEQMAALDGLDVNDEELRQNFTGIMFKVPAGSGRFKVNAETTGKMTLKVKVGNGQTVEMELSGKQEMKFPYEVDEESLVYIFAGTTNQSNTRGSGIAESSLKIYSIEWGNNMPTGDVNGDNQVDKNDLDDIVKHIMGETLSGFNKIEADLNEDGVINAADIVILVDIINKPLK